VCVVYVFCVCVMCVVCVLCVCLYKVASDLYDSEKR